MFGLCGIDATAPFVVSWLFKAAGHLSETAGDGLTQAASVFVVSQSATSLADYFRTYEKLPINHDMARGFRRAALRALQAILTEEEINRLDWNEEMATTKAIKRLRRWAAQELRRLRHYEFADTPSAPVISVVQSALADPVVSPNEARLHLQRGVEDALLAEIESGINCRLPHVFVERFRGNKPACIGWFDWACRNVLETLKDPKEEAFRNIVTASLQAVTNDTLASIKVGLNALAAQVDRLGRWQRGEQPDALAPYAEVTRVLRSRVAVGEAHATISKERLEALAKAATLRHIGQLALQEVADELFGDHEDLEASLQRMIKDYEWLRPFEAGILASITRGDAAAVVAALRDAEELFEPRLAAFRRDLRAATQDVARLRAAQGDAMRSVFAYQVAASHYEQAAATLRDMPECASLCRKFHCDRADALLQDGRRFGAVESLRKAILVLIDEVIAPTEVPVRERAFALNLSGVALTALAAEIGAEDGVVYVDEAVSALREAVAGSAGYQRAEAFRNLGAALIMQGSKPDSDGRRHLIEAERCYAMALSVYTRDRTPYEFALCKAGLGLALAALGRADCEDAAYEEN